VSTLWNVAEHRSVLALEPAQYCFDPSRTKRSTYAWPGLERYGPYDRESFPRRTPRLLVVSPDTVAGRVSQAMKMFRDGISSLDRSVYDKGFTDTFRLVNPEWLLVDYRVVDVPMTYNSTFVMLSSLKSLFFSSLKNEL